MKSTTANEINPGMILSMFKCRSIGRCPGVKNMYCMMPKNLMEYFRVSVSCPRNAPAVSQVCAQANRQRSGRKRGIEISKKCLSVSGFNDPKVIGVVPSYPVHVHVDKSKGNPCCDVYHECGHGVTYLVQFLARPIDQQCRNAWRQDRVSLPDWMMCHYGSRESAG